MGEVGQLNTLRKFGENPEWKGEKRERRKKGKNRGKGKKGEEKGQGKGNMRNGKGKEERGDKERGKEE